MSFEQLESRLAMAVVISEFVAENHDGLTDFAGDHEDWIELRNTGAATVDVAGWHLTDDALDLTKWQIPSHASTQLDPGEYLTIFASDKNGIFSNELHTNFKLNESGEYLGLVMPNGTTVASDFGAVFPEQFADVSYGSGASASSTTDVTLVGASSSLSVISPSAENAAVDDFWRESNFDDSGWLTGTRSVGFDRDGDGTSFTSFIGRTLSIGEMPSTRTTAYVRYDFNVTDKDQFTSLQLDLRFDDGFIVYLNGHEVQRANFGEFWQKPQPAWNSSAGYMLRESSALVATNRGAEALTPVAFDLTPYLFDVVNGNNVLAFHAVNSGSTSTGGGKDDFLLEPVLTAVRATGAEVANTYMAGPTPGDDNGVGTLGLVADTQFSVDRGFYDTAQLVEITTTTPGATIRYTTDGSEPTLGNGITYTSPINVGTTTILRAAAFKSGWTSSNVDTETYIFLADVIQQSAADVTQPYATWGRDKDGDGLTGYDLDDGSDWEMDPDVVNDLRWSSTIIDDLKSIPSMSVVMDWDDLFGGTPQPGTPSATTTVAPLPQGMYIHGRGDERAMSLEYFNPDVPTDQFQIDGAIETQGHTSQQRWKSDKLSFQVKFKNPYGSTKLNYPFFADALYGDTAASEFDTLILDAVHNYGWTHSNFQQFAVAKFVTDQVMADLQNLAGGQAAHGKFVHLYLNGFYWGIYNVHERPDDSFDQEYYGGDKDDYDVIKHASDDPTRKYSWVEGGVTAENSFQSLIDATQAVQDDPTNSTKYQTVRDVLDVDDFIDYMIVHYYGGNVQDWSNNNWYATHNRVEAGAKWHFHEWDQEHAFPTDDNQPLGQNTGEDADSTGFDQTQTPTAIHRNLIANEEYRLKFADRVQKLFQEDMAGNDIGLLTPTVAAAVYAARANEIDRAIVGESARWGDNRLPFTSVSPAYSRTAPYNRDDFIAINNGVLNDFFPVRSSIVLGQFDVAGWIPSLDAPLLSQYGGEIPVGFQLTLTKPGGSPGAATIYYTTDGTDPRLVGGGLSPSAIAYSGPLALAASTQVKARIFFNNSGTANDWSPIVDATFVLDQPFPVRIVEINYHPADYPGVADDEDLEFIELLNTGNSTVSLEGVQITAFSSTPYVFGSGISLDAGERIVVARDPVVFQSVYGNAISMAPVGFDPDNLSNGGESIGLLGPASELIQLFTYDDVAAWPTSPDGSGPSLEYIGPLDAGENPNDGSPADPFDNPVNWRASHESGGSPGTDGEVPLLAGDYDASGTVDPLDYAKWKADFGMMVTPGEGADGNANGVVDAADYTVWRNNLGATQPPRAGSLAGGAGLVVDVPGGAEVSFGFEFGFQSVPRMTSATSTIQVRQTALATEVDANLLLWQVLGPVVAGRRDADGELDSLVNGVANDEVEPSKLWEDDAWIERLGRGV